MSRRCGCGDRHRLDDSPRQPPAQTHRNHQEPSGWAPAGTEKFRRIGPAKTRVDPAARRLRCDLQEAAGDRRDFRLLGDITLSISSGYGYAASSRFVIRFVVHGHRYRVVVVQTESGLPPLRSLVGKCQGTAAAEIGLTPASSRRAMARRSRRARTGLLATSTA
jgi:hypothetical protein